MPAARSDIAAGFPNDPCDIILQGNPAVKPETSDTSTVGVVLTPGGCLDGFQFAADYYDIKLKNGITPAGGQLQDLLQLCRQMGGMTCLDVSWTSAIFNDAALTGRPVGHGALLQCPVL